MITVLEIWEEFEEHHIYVFKEHISDEDLQPFIKQFCEDFGWAYEGEQSELWHSQIIRTEFSSLSS